MVPQLREKYFRAILSPTFSKFTFKLYFWSICFLLSFTLTNLYAQTLQKICRPQCSFLSVASKKVTQSKKNLKNITWPYNQEKISAKKVLFSFKKYSFLKNCERKLYKHLKFLQSTDLKNNTWLCYQCIIIYPFFW